MCLFSLKASIHNKCNTLYKYAVENGLERMSLQLSYMLLYKAGYHQVDIDIIECDATECLELKNGSEPS